MTWWSCGKSEQCEGDYNYMLDIKRKLMRKETSEEGTMDSREYEC